MNKREEGQVGAGEERSLSPYLQAQDINRTNVVAARIIRPLRRGVGDLLGHVQLRSRRR